MSYTIEFNEIATLVLRAYGLEDVTAITLLTQTEADANSPWLASSSADLLTAHDDLVRLMLELHPDLHELGCTQACLDAYESMLLQQKFIGNERNQSESAEQRRLEQLMVDFCKMVECPDDYHFYRNEEGEAWCIVGRSDVRGTVDCWVALVSCATEEDAEAYAIFDEREVARMDDGSLKIVVDDERQPVMIPCAVKNDTDVIVEVPTGEAGVSFDELARRVADRDFNNHCRIVVFERGQQPYLPHTAYCGPFAPVSLLEFAEGATVSINGSTC